MAIDLAEVKQQGVELQLGRIAQESQSDVPVLDRRHLPRNRHVVEQCRLPQTSLQSSPGIDCQRDTDEQPTGISHAEPVGVGGGLRSSCR